MLQSELNEILDLHELWVKDNSKGKQADLSNQNLSNLDFSGRNLSYITMNRTNLSYVDFSDANLSYSRFSFSNLSYADLSNVKFDYGFIFNADLSNANLHAGNFYYANFYSANLSYAKLSDAVFFHADLSDVNFLNTDISNTIFYHVKLYDSKLENVDFSRFNICPKEGQFYGFKKVQGGFILKLLISKYAKRLNPVGSRKCRASKVKAVEAFKLNGSKTDQTKFISYYNPNFEYEVGKWIEVKNFNDDIRETNVPGIHFFLTKEEAMDYKYC